jgi:hypothetical protein
LGFVSKIFQAKLSLSHKFQETRNLTSSSPNNLLDRTPTRNVLALRLMLLPSNPRVRKSELRRRRKLLKKLSTSTSKKMIRKSSRLSKVTPSTSTLTTTKLRTKKRKRLEFSKHYCYLPLPSLLSAVCHSRILLVSPLLSFAT